MDAFIRKKMLLYALCFSFSEALLISLKLSADMLPELKSGRIHAAWILFGLRTKGSFGIWRVSETTGAWVGNLADVILKAAEHILSYRDRIFLSRSIKPASILTPLLLNGTYRMFYIPWSNTCYWCFDCYLPNAPVPNCIIERYSSIMFNCHSILSFSTRRAVLFSLHARPT